jgi:histidyl-tRNA synthetase
MATNATLAKGTRDFYGDELNKRQFMIRVIEKHFKQFGFSRIETPSFENYTTLIGKYGEEGDRLIFKILKSGDYLAKANPNILASKDSQELTPEISDKALRYDLTVPFARFVVQHQNELAFPFKRYQIQPVWRADRPQKGRFREFTQCDADVVGVHSLWQELELLQLYNAVFSELGLVNEYKVKIKLNNRKLLSGLAEVLSIGDRLTAFMTVLDKLDKIGAKGVAEELELLGFDNRVWDTMQFFLDSQRSLDQRISKLHELLADSLIGIQGLRELEFLFANAGQFEWEAIQLSFDLTLARGLHYYTGTLFEVNAPESVQLGAIGGGGRYDNLTKAFGGSDMSGVGISFGLDRLYLVLEELGLFGKYLEDQIDVVVLFFEHTDPLLLLQVVDRLRALGLSTEMYPEAAKTAKQFKYAEKRKARFVFYIDQKNDPSKPFILKNMKTSELHECNLESLHETIKLIRSSSTQS